MEKLHIRENILNRKKELSHEAVLEWSRTICSFLNEFISQHNFDQVIAYWPLKNEVQILEVLATVAKNKKIFILADKNGGLKEINDLLKHHRKPAKSWTGLESLTRQLPTLPATSFKGSTLVIAPGLAFGKDGSRLGYGGGYFDRLFAISALQLNKVGVCFSFQLADQLPQSNFDQKVDAVITENGVIKPDSSDSKKSHDHQFLS